MRLIYLIYALPALRVDALIVPGLEHPLWFVKEIRYGIYSAYCSNREQLLTMVLD